MSDLQENQIQDWLKKLERESWQLELLVSAFTIFLLIGAKSAYEEFSASLNFRYNMSANAILVIISVFLIVIKNSILALTISLIVHLMLRGFWIGTIGLRSVQSDINFEALNYNAFFTEKLKKNVISLDRLVVILDEICSVIFSFSFLIISVLIAFGMYLAFLGIVGAGVGVTVNFFNGSIVVIVISMCILLILFIMGLIFMIDYLSLGFFKKIRWFSKIYYPFYRLFNFITLSGLSRSIYYYMISKFSKKRIRIVYAVIITIVMFLFLFEFDQHQYFPDEESSQITASNYYADQRDEDDFAEKISIPGNLIEKPFLPLFIRYDASDNPIIRTLCPEFIPLKQDGLNTTMQIYAKGANLTIQGKDYSSEDTEAMLACHSSIYQIVINDSIYSDLNFRFYSHPARQQKGLYAVIPTASFKSGENVMRIKKMSNDDDGAQSFTDYAVVPFWFHEK